MKNVSLKLALATAVKAARAAGRLLRANWRKPKRVYLAEAHDIKLELDVRCQSLIERTLRAAFPGIPLLGEEGVSGDVTAEYRWVVDPIDGTVNYFFGVPHAAVSIALQHRGTSVVGVILDPVTDEIWTTARGRPTRLNGKIIHVSNRSKIEDCIIAMGFSKSQDNLEKSLPHLIRIARRAKKIRIMGSAALELVYVASGRLDAYIERTLSLWDVAAGSLLVENAGGEFYAVPAPGDKMRICADNGLLRKKLQLGSLFE
jgi:myo-inositol-1(or 4)-monophosphatase